MRAPIRQPDVTGGRGCTNTVTFNVKCRKKTRLYRGTRSRPSYIRPGPARYIRRSSRSRVDFRGVERRRRHDTTRHERLPPRVSPSRAFSGRRSIELPAGRCWLADCSPRLHRKRARALLVRLIASVPDDARQHARMIAGGRRVLREYAALQLDESDERLISS